MRFIDEAIIRIYGGHGGPGSVSFRRETFVPRGGPDGGDGGAGGSVSIRANAQLATLQDFRFKREYRAPAGMHGSGTNKAGKDGEHIVLQVPVGTVVKDAETGDTLVDFVEDGQTWVACKGGRGGKGNAHFVSSTFQAPKFAQPGEEGEHREIRLELKLLCDVGIIGFPNAGKSTLISRVSAARPKIADYPFTTLTPNLGVVSLEEYRSFVIADFPGLIEGAHRGEGLGIQFLKHIERSRLFIHLLDTTQILEDLTRASEGDDPEEQEKQALEKLFDRYVAIRRELGLFNEALLHKPEMLVLNKVDLLQSDPKLVERVSRFLRDRIASVRGTHPAPGEPWIISGVSGEGIPNLLGAIDRALSENRRTHDGQPSKTEVLLPDADRLRTKKS